MISREDYEEQCCPLEKPNKQIHIPISRLIEKLDDYLFKKDFSAAERHLSYWLSEALMNKDLEGCLSIYNEQIGLFRRTEQKGKCLNAIEKVLELTETLDLTETLTLGTTYINAATGYKAFSQADKALPLYEKAREIYEDNLKEDDPRRAGLYNNMALSLMDLKRYTEAEELFLKALAIEEGELDGAITCCNLADLKSLSLNPEEAEKEIEKYLTKAEKIFDSSHLLRDSYYAFVCEKCAPVFGYYGFFFAEKELEKRAKEIYERA